ncbi:unnamed protein product, partial [marine sediment metagenome]
ALRTTTIGCKAGDLALEIDGEEVTRFQTLFTKAALAGPDDRFRLKIQREIDGKTYVGTTTIGVKSLRTDSGGQVFAMGIGWASDVVFGPSGEIVDLPFQDGDRIVAVDGRAIEHMWDIAALAKTLIGPDPNVQVPNRVELTVRRGEERRVQATPVLLLLHHHVLFLKDTGQPLKVKPSEKKESGDDVSLQPANGAARTVKKDRIIDSSEMLLDILGMAPRFMIPVVIPGSPADKAGLRPGDIVLNYADTGTPTFGQF